MSFIATTDDKTSLCDIFCFDFEGLSSVRMTKGKA